MTSIALATVLLTSSVPAQNKAGDVISTCMARYHGEVYAAGDILLTAAVGNEKVQFKTTMQFVRPNKIYIHQAVVGKNKSALIVSDGTVLRYPNPKPQFADRPVFEAVKQRDDKLLEVDDMYGVASQFLLDRSVPLEFVMNRTVDLELFSKLVTNLKYEGEAVLRGKDVDMVSGNLKSHPGGPIVGSFKMYVGKSGDMLRFERVEMMQIENRQIKAGYAWDVDVTVGKKEAVNDKLFRVR
ncbi:MAG: hypothetical protein KDC26_12000 [Armatimonadetes bacterium]|nr:hypothetical protein [Armatimonadota bacterium]